MSDIRKNLIPGPTFGVWSRFGDDSESSTPLPDPNRR
jgi:hypothetical protein